MDGIRMWWSACADSEQIHAILDLYECYCGITYASCGIHHAQHALWMLFRHLWMLFIACEICNIHLALHDLSLKMSMMLGILKFVVRTTSMFWPRKKQKALSSVKLMASKIQRGWRLSNPIVLFILSSACFNSDWQLIAVVFVVHQLTLLGICFGIS